MIYRIDVASTDARDSSGESVRHQIQEFGTKVGPISTRRVFLIDTDATASQVQRIATELLADPVVERAAVVTQPHDDAGKSRIEIHLKPGVMDPVAASTEMAIRDMGLAVREVRTGRSFVIEGVVAKEELQRIASRVLANGVIESVHFDTFLPEKFQTGHDYQFKLRHVDICTLNDDQLKKLSREGHLFLSLDEMRAIQTYYKQQGREPTDIELETFAQTWSEHCVHKTLKSSVDVYDESGNFLRRYGNLIKETIFGSTMELMGKAPRTTDAPPVSSSFIAAQEHGRGARGTTEEFCLSVFKDNAGVVVFDDVDAVCFKVETHNHPSAIEPYGGSATGAGGCIRDILGTGLGAKPIANTDVFCVAYPDTGDSIRNPQTEIRNLPKGVIHPKRVLQQVVAGVRDYGNRMGIPTVNGAVYFDDRYVGNPLVFCGCVGLIPRDKINKAARPGDAIVVMGGRTGRDGIHGATFSSAELTDTHADEFSHAVQIGNAITEKKVADVILAARDRNLFTGITDCGAGGLSSAVGEMGEKTGAHVSLETVPLKYAGLRYDEIWISEAQERMVLSVPQEKVKELIALSEAEDVESTVIGHFGTENRELILTFRGTEVARLAMSLLHDGIPMPTRRATVRTSGVSPGHPSLPSFSLNENNKETDQMKNGRDARATAGAPDFVKKKLLALLAHPNIASKHWIIRQYDHEVQGGSVVKPLVGPMQIGPSDAAVVRPKLNSMKGVVISCGLAPHVKDPYDMAVAAIDEAIRNAVCVGAEWGKIAILDNFCWPSVDSEQSMGDLVRTCEACRDAALAYGIPFISGKDSLHNQFTNSETGQVIRIPNTLLVSALGVIDDVRKCVTMDLKHRTGRVVLVSANSTTDLAILASTARLISQSVGTGKILSAHDASDGGVLVAAAEMCIASGLGLIVGGTYALSDAAFVERPGQYLLEVAEQADADALRETFSGVAGVIDFGLVQHFRKLTITTEKERVLELGLDELTAAWRGTLDW